MSEQSARAVQRRADLTDAERMERAPWLDYSGDGNHTRGATPSPMPGTSVEVMPLLPERAALEAAYRGIGLDPTSRHTHAAIEAMKGKWNKDNAASGFSPLMNSSVDAALGRSGESSLSKDPRWQAWGRAMEDYYNKVQQLGHNGGPEPSTWPDPFLYSLRAKE